MDNATEKDLYYVAVKLFVEHDGRLLITKDIYDDGWDLPGGRLQKGEFGAPFAEVVARKMTEELGGDFSYTLGEPVVHFRHERIEGTTGTPVRIFGIGYRAEYDGGEITLGDHHTSYEWVDIATFNPDEYFRGGWLVGVREYLEVRRRELKQ